MAEETNEEKANREATEAAQKRAEESRQGGETEPQTPPRKKKAASGDLVDQFLELSGYTKADVLGHNDSRRTVVTANGGKYEVSKKGTRLRKLAGPDTPADLEAAAEEDDD